MRRLLRTIRNLMMLTLLAAIVTAGILIANALMLHSRQLQVAALPRVVIDEDGVSKRLAVAIRLQTISNFQEADENADAFMGMLAHIEASYPAFTSAVKREIVNKYSLLYTWPGTDPNAAPIAFLAHQDVVPIAPGTESSWEYPPFDGVIRDGFIWGRGSWDDKGNLFALVEAAEMLAKSGFRPSRTIYFAFGHDEEVSGQRGAKAIATLFAARGIKLDFVMDEGMLITEGIVKGLTPPAAIIGVAEKGYVTLNLTAHGSPGHSSLPPKTTAIGAMSAALARLDARRLPAEISGPTLQTFQTLAPEMDWPNRIVLSNLWLLKPLILSTLEKSPTTDAAVRTTTAFTMFNAGNQDNVLPGSATATVNFRLLPGATQAGVIDHVRSAIGNDTIDIAAGPGNNDPPPVTSTDTAAYRTLDRTIREIFPDVVVAPGLMVAATDSRHYAGVTDNIFRFSPVRATTEDLSRFHGTNERLAVPNYLDMIRFYRRLLQASAG